PPLAPTARARALFGLVEPPIARVEVHGQLAFAAHTLPRIFVGRRGIVGIDVEPPRQPAREAQRGFGGGGARARAEGKQLRIAPDRHAVAPPPATERPARQRLARI